MAAEVLGKSAWGLLLGIRVSLRNAPGGGWSGTVGLVGLAAGAAANGPAANKGCSEPALPQDKPCWVWLHTCPLKFISINEQSIWKAIPSKTHHAFQGAGSCELAHF